MAYRNAPIFPVSHPLLLLLFISGSHARGCDITRNSDCKTIMIITISIIAVILIVSAVIAISKWKRKQEIKSNPYIIRSTRIRPLSSPNPALLAKYNSRSRSTGQPSAPSRVVISIPLSTSERNVTSPYSSCTVEDPSPIPSNDCIAYPPPYSAGTRPPKYY